MRRLFPLFAVLLCCGQALAQTPPVVKVSGTTIIPIDATKSFSSSRIISTVVTGTAPFTVTSTTPVANLSIGGNAVNVTGIVAIANGGTNAATASAARTNLGATTLGANLFTITNPSAITFPRYNADNTVTALSASAFRTAIGAGTGAGDALVASPLSQFAATASAQLRGVLSDEINGTGGLALFGNQAVSTGSDVVFATATTSSVSTSGSGSLGLSSINITSTAWTTSGGLIRVGGVSLTDTTSSGTVATACDTVFSQNTIASTDPTTFTNYVGVFAREPLAGTNVTFTNRWALGADSLRIGTSNHLTVTTGGVLAATSPVFTTPNLGTPSALVVTNASGTASININGTVGATTPAAVTATVLTGTSGTHTGLTGLGIRSTGAAFDLTLASSEVLTAGKTLSFNVSDAARVITLSGNPTLVTGTMAVVGNPLSQFAATTSAQLLGVLSDETGTGAAVFAGSPTFTGTVTAAALSTTGATTLGDATGDTVTFNADTWTAPTAIAWAKTSQASTSESLLSMTVSDDAVSSFGIFNAVSTDAQFSAQFRGVQGSTLAALSFSGRGTTDTGTAPISLYVSQLAAGTAVAVRDTHVFRNFTTDQLGLTFGHNLQLRGGATSPTLLGATADIVSMVGVDRVNTRFAAAGNRSLAIQAERGSAIYVGADAIDFAAATAIVSVNGTDLLTLTSTTAISSGTLTSSSATAGIGYSTGAGGTVTQTTTRLTGVTINKICGTITTDTTALLATANATFTVTNSAVAIGDVVNVSIRSGATNVDTFVKVSATAAGSFNVTLCNKNAAVSEVGAIIINFVVVKGVTS